MEVKPPPKAALAGGMTVVNHAEVNAHVKIGDIIVKDNLNTGINLISTKAIGCKEG